MKQIEFETTIAHGTIEVPPEFAATLTGRVRVIIMTPEDDEEVDMIEYLMEHPLQPTTEDATHLAREDRYDRHA